MDAGALDHGDHAERMDGIYRVQRHFYDLTRKYYLLGRDRLIARLAVPVGGSVLEIGCGTGRNLALIARRYPSARLYGLDISAEMLKAAQANLRKTGAEARTRLAQADAAAFDARSLFGPYGTDLAGFDRVFCSYTLSMIPDWPGALAMALAALAPGGELHIVDFGQQERLPGWFRRALHRWLALFHVTPRAEILSVCARLAREQGCTLESHALYRDYARYLVLKRG